MTDETNGENPSEEPEFIATPTNELKQLGGSALLDLLNQGGARKVLKTPAQDLGFAESMPFPFLAMVGQLEMRFALLIGVINPAVGGVLLLGPRGVGKTTCVRGLVTILPDVPIIDQEIPLEEQPDAEELPTRWEQVKLIELPLNARLDDVVGGINERIAIQQNRIRLERGILARADQNVLYIDEVNLLENDIINAIIDASAQGHYVVRRGPMVGTFRSRFVMVGSMNPEEGNLRPQIMDRFGLRVLVSAQDRPDERLLVYQRVRAYRQTPQEFLRAWARSTAIVREEIGMAQELLKETTLSEEALKAGIELVTRLEIESNRAEYTLFEAARAHAAADGRTVAEIHDIRYVAPMALRLRRSAYMTDYIRAQADEEAQIQTTFDSVVQELPKKKPKRRSKTM